MGQALYRKYRPKSFSETVGQEPITKTLAEAVKSGRISHAYLFAGPKGVGKTSFARILAHEINKLAYKDDSIDLDIIEIDAASNRRIDEIRELRDKVHISPASAKYKVYIIDEVHMLTKEAFNALLKTLEEPPEHCVFILATTEAYKLPETIISRTQRFNFKPIGREATKKQLKKIAKSEKIQIDDTGIELLAEFGEGSLRDIISLLEQLSLSGKKIGEAEIRNLLGLPPQQQIDQLADNTLSGNSPAVLADLDALTEFGANPQIVAKLLSANLRNRILADGAREGLVKLLKDLLEVPASSQPRDSLEIAVLDAVSAQVSLQPAATNTDFQSRHEVASKEVVVKDPVKENKVKKAVKRKSGSSQFSLDKWPEVLGRVKAAAPRLYTALRLAKPSVEDNELTLTFGFGLHQKKLKEPKNLKLLADLIEEVSGADVSINCVVDKSLNSQPENQSRPSGQNVESISSIFGSAEVLES